MTTFRTGLDLTHRRLHSKLGVQAEAQIDKLRDFVKGSRKEANVAVSRGAGREAGADVERGWPDLVEEGRVEVEHTSLNIVTRP